MMFTNTVVSIYCPGDVMPLFHEDSEECGSDHHKQLYCHNIGLQASVFFSIFDGKA